MYLIRGLNLHSREEGQTLSEYSLLLAFILLATVAAVTAVGLAIVGLLDDLVPAF